MDRKNWSLIAVVVAASALVAGCGGGTSGSSASAGTTTSVTGTAATGAPIVGGSVQMICAGGIAGTAVTTSATGTYTVTATTGLAPCVIRVTGGTGNVGASLFSLVQSGQTVAHTNQLTHMLVYNVAGGNPDTLLFLAPSSIAGLVTSAKVASVTAIVQTVVAALGEALGISTSFDFLQGTFTADSTGFDRLLDNITFSTSALTATATAPVIIFKGTGTVILTINATTGLIVGSAPAVIVVGQIPNLGGLGAFVDVLKTRVFGSSLTFADLTAARNSLSDVISAVSGTLFLTTTNNPVFQLISSLTTASGIRINTSLASLASLTTRAPTLTSVISSNINTLRVAFNFTATSDPASTMTSKAADVARTASGSTSTVWRLMNITP